MENFVSQFNKIETEQDLRRFLSYCETIILITMTETLKEFLPIEQSQTSIDCANCATQMGNVCDYLVSCFDQIKEFTSKEDLDLYIITATIPIILGALEESDSIRLCPQWTPLQATKCINANKKDETIFFYFDKHISTCGTCKTCHSISVNIIYKTLTRDARCVIEHPHWHYTKQEIIDKYSKGIKPSLSSKKHLAILVILAVALVSLFAGILLSLTKQSTTLAVPLVMPRVNIGTNPLYDHLNNGIDRYLESKNTSDLQQAQRIASEIDKKYGDKYGLDLVAYYRSLPTEEFQGVRQCRKEVMALTFSPGDNSTKVLTEAKQLIGRLNAINNRLEVYRVKIVMAKTYALAFNETLDNENLITDGIEYSTNKKYLFLKLNFLLWRAKDQRVFADHRQAEILFEQVIELAKFLNLEQEEGSAIMSLAMACHQHNHNNKALELTTNAINRNLKYFNMASIWYVKGLAEFSKGMREIADQSLKKSLALAQNSNDPFNISLCYVFLGVTSSEKGEFEKAEFFFTQAEKIGTSLEEPEGFFDLFSRINGYRAKSKLLQGDYSSAVYLYKDTLSKLEKLKIKDDLELSQVNTGLAISLEKTGQTNEAIKYRLEGERHLEIANTKKEHSNCLMSFLPMRLQCD